MRNGTPSRSPEDLFVFDMMIHGVRGDALNTEEALNPEELEVFGVDCPSGRIGVTCPLAYQIVWLDATLSAVPSLTLRE